MLVVGKGFLLAMGDINYLVIPPLLALVALQSVFAVEDFVQPTACLPIDPGQRSQKGGGPTLAAILGWGLHQVAQLRTFHVGGSRIVWSTSPLQSPLSQ